MCGIYMIRNTINGKLYIGKSVNIKKRFNEHKHELRLGSHHNDYLQKAWNKYGEDAFEFIVLEECDRENLNSLEIATIAKFASSNELYNMTDGGDGMLGRIMSDETKALIGAHTSHKVILLNTRQVFSSIAQAAEQYGLTTGAIVLACCGKTKSAGRANGEALAWAKYGEFVSMSDSDIQTKISLAQDGLKYDIKEVVLLNTKERFCSAGDAAEAYSVHTTNIASCCRHERRYAGCIDGVKLVWRYATEYDAMSENQIRQAINTGNSPLSRRVVLLNTGEVFDSTTAASIAYSLSETTVYSNCNGIRQSGGTYNGMRLAWVYEDEYLSMTAEEVSSKISTASGTRNCAKKQVKLVNTGDIFSSVSAAAKFYGLQRKGIAKCCSGAIQSYGTFDNQPMVWVYC